jgi:hypothetical protein
MFLARNRRLTLLLSAVGVVGAAAALSIGASYALFDSTATPQTATISAATVILTNTGSANSTSCSFNDIVPGDNLGTACTYTVDYSGTAQAFLLLNVATASTSGTPGTKALIDGGAYGFVPQISYANGTGTQLFGYSTGTGPACTTSSGGESCTSSDSNQVVSTGGPITSGSYTFTISGAMNNGTDIQNNPYQGGSGTIKVTAWAVQSQNNTNNASNGGGPMYPTGPVIQSVTSSSTTALAVGYNVAMEATYSSSGSTTDPSQYYATDVNQSTPSSPDVCQYSVTGAPDYTNQGPVDLGKTVDLTLFTCSNGSTPNAGDVLNFTYNFYNPTQVYMYLNGADPSTLAHNDDYPESPDLFWNVTVG